MRRTETAGSMSFRLKWMNKLDEDVYIVYNSILIRFNFLQCHFFKCLPYKIPAGHKIFIIFFFNILITHNHKLKMATEKR